MRYVVDASVAARFILSEELSDKAARVLEDFLSGRVELIAPSLVVYEVGNTLWKAVRRGLVSEEDALESFAEFLKLKLWRELEIEEELGALRWGSRNDSTYYDSAYVAMAGSEGAVLLTADDGLEEKARTSVRVLHLRDYGGWKA